MALSGSVTVKRKGNRFTGSILRALTTGPSAVKVGLPAGKSDASVIAVALYNEFGTRHIPARPAMSNALHGNRRVYRAALRKLASSVFRAAALGGNASAAKATGFARLGALAQGHMQAEIVSLRSPANAPSTIARKGSSNPLIDEGRYRRSITYKVED